MFLILCVLGSMYGGLATPSEAAGVGVLGALVVARLQGELKWPALRAIAIGAVQTCSMIALIVLGASILGSAAAFLSIPARGGRVRHQPRLSPLHADRGADRLLSDPGLLPRRLQHDRHDLAHRHADREGRRLRPIWFGIFLVLVVEMAQITPPVGFNLFVIQGLTEDGLGYIARVTLPYLLIMVGFTMVITLFPDIALWLPRYLGS